MNEAGINGTVFAANDHLWQRGILTDKKQWLVTETGVYWEKEYIEKNPEVLVAVASSSRSI